MQQTQQGSGWTVSESMAMGSAGTMEGRDPQQHRRQAFRQQLVSTLKGKLRDDCMRRCQQMRSATLSARRAATTNTGSATEHPSMYSGSNNGAPSSEQQLKHISVVQTPQQAPMHNNLQRMGIQGDTSGQHLEPVQQQQQQVPVQVSQDVRRDVQTAVTASLASLRQHHHSHTQGHAKKQRLEPCTPTSMCEAGMASPATATMQRSLLSTGTDSGCAMESDASQRTPSHQHQQQQWAQQQQQLQQGAQQQIQLQQQQHWAQQTQLQQQQQWGQHHHQQQQSGTQRLSSQHWEDDAWDKELADYLASITEEEMEAMQRQLEDSLFEEVMAAQLQEMYQEELQSSGTQPQDPDAVPCPVCHASNLVLRNGFLACPAEGWHLDVRAESMTLQHVRQQLADAFQASSFLPETQAKLGMLKSQPSLGPEWRAEAA